MLATQNGQSASGKQQAQHHPARTREASDSQQIRMLQLDLAALAEAELYADQLHNLVQVACLHGA